MLIYNYNIYPAHWLPERDNKFEKEIIFYGQF